MTVFTEAAPPSAQSAAPAQVVESAAAAEPAVQREADADTPTISPADIPAAGAPAEPGAPAAPGASGIPGAANPDELVKKLFEPLLRRLKTELRLDRERRGILTDLRH